jgi:murein DD-endopeptidase MepM/ murein hydrolase activator NlpD
VHLRAGGRNRDAVEMHRSFRGALVLFLLLSIGTLYLRTEEAGGLHLKTTPTALDNGSPFLLTVTPTAKVSSVNGTWMGKKLSFFRGKASGGAEAWYALAGVDVDVVPGKYPLSVEATDAGGKQPRAEMALAIGAAKYRTGTLTVSPNFVEPDAATKKEIAADKELKDKVFAHSADVPEWAGDFAKPVNAAATDSFGTRRTFNGKLASVHRGMDFRAPSGTPVAAANSGKVVIAQKLFYEGNCVVIDHGLGFMTLYMHLSRIDVTAGEMVHKGQRLGLSGATGRVTGPHLHFAVRWRDAYLDPAGLFGLKLMALP